MAALAEFVVRLPLVVRMPDLKMSEDQFFDFCQANDDLQIERTVEGEILIMAPAGIESGHLELEIAYQVHAWAKKDGSGVAFGPSAGFRLANGAVRSPDSAWISKARLARLTAKQKKKFAPICPDFVIELLSPSDTAARVKAKMQEYIDNGAQLGWFIDPGARQVLIYRPGQRIRRLEQPKTVSGHPLLPGFVLDLKNIWNPVV